MKTPAGTECRYFYGDYRRGRNHEECRLVENDPSAKKWTSDLCKHCPVPAIQRANACPNLVLQGKVKSGFLGLGRQIVYSAYCTLSKTNVTEPHIGCGQCHPLPLVFTEPEHDPHSTA